MLQILHRLSGSFVARALFGVLLIGFVIFGIGDVLRMHSVDTDVAEVGHTTITAEHLDKEFRQRLASFSQRLGGKIDLATAKRVGYMNHVLDAMIDETLMKLTVRDYGFRIGDRQVLDQMRMIPAFLDDTTHELDREKINRVLGANQMSEATFVPYLREQTALKLLNDSELGPIKPPQLLVTALYDYQHQQRRGETLHLSDAAMSVPAPTAEQMDAYYKAHAEKFTAPEYRNFSYIVLSLADLAKEIPVSAEELKQAYDSRASEFQVPERRELQQVLLQDQAKAQQVAEFAKKDKSLADAAKTINEGARFSALGLMSKTDLPASLQDPVFTASAGTVLPPIKTPLGWHVIAVEKIEPARQMTFDEVKGTLESDIKGEKAQDKLLEVEKKIDDQLAGGAKLSEAAAAFNLKPVTIGPVDADGKKPDGAAIAEMKDEGELLKAAFAAAEGSAAEMQDAKGGDAFAVEVDHITPPALRDLNVVKDAIAKDVLQEEKEKAANTKAEELAAEIKKGTNFGALSKTANAIPVPIGPVMRDAKDKTVPALVTKALFELAKPGDVTVIADSDGPTLVHLLEIIPAAKGESDPGIAGELSNSLQKDITGEFMLALRQRYPVKINDKALEQLKAAN